VASFRFVTAPSLSSLATDAVPRQPKSRIGSSAERQKDRNGRHNVCVGEPLLELAEHARSPFIRASDPGSLLPRGITHCLRCNTPQQSCADQVASSNVRATGSASQSQDTRTTRHRCPSPSPLRRRCSSPRRQLSHARDATVATEASPGVVATW
jgi:hypothetical protein